TLVRTSETLFVRASRWMPDGKGLIIAYPPTDESRDQIGYVAYPGGAVHRVTNDLNSYERNSLTVTADGKAIATVQEDRNYGLWLRPAGGGASDKAQQIGNAHDEGWSVEWSTDDKIFTEFNTVVRRAGDGSNKETVVAPAAPISGLAVCGSYVVIAQV